MDPRLRARFFAAWIASRVIDSITTWHILRNSLGRELNPIAAKFIEYLGLEKGLTAFTAIGVLLGFALSIVIPRLLQCEWCMTPLDRMIFSALGRERVAEIIMYTAVALSFVPAIANLSLIIYFSFK